MSDPVRTHTGLTRAQATMWGASLLVVAMLASLVTLLIANPDRSAEVVPGREEDYTRQIIDSPLSEGLWTDDMVIRYGLRICRNTGDLTDQQLADELVLEANALSPQLANLFVERAHTVLCPS